MASNAVARTEYESWQERRRQAARRLARSIEEARRCPKAFRKFVMRVEGDAPPRRCEVHDEWDDYLTENQFAVLFAPVDHGKSFVVTRSRLLWEIGNDPNLRIGICSAASGNPDMLPNKMLSSIKAEIQTNARLRQVFPRLRPQTEGQVLWTENAIIVERSDTLPDPSFQVFSPGKKILGGRLNRLVADDLCDFDNTFTEYQREKMYQWFSREVLGRVKKKREGGRIWMIGHFWHDDDCLNRMAARHGFAKRVYDAFVEPHDGAIPDDVQSAAELGQHCRPLAHELYNLQDLWDKAVLFGGFGSIDADLMLRNRPPRQGAGRFKVEWFVRCMERGIGLGFEQTWKGSPTYTGVDLGHRKKAGSDYTSIYTWTVLPTGDLKILDIRTGRWSGPEIIEQLEMVHDQFGSQITVEDNGAQNFLLEFAREMTIIPLEGATTGINKHSRQFGVESLGILLSQGKVIIPSTMDGKPANEEIRRWIQECMAYDPMRHPGDRLMASWICLGGTRKSVASGVEILDVDMLER